MKLIRGAVIALGLAVLSLLGVVELGLRRRSDAAGSSTGDDAAEVTGTLDTPPSRAVVRTRRVLGVLGVLVALYGATLLLQTVPWTNYLGIALWLVGAIVLHDAVLVPAVSVLRVGAVRLSRPLPGQGLAVLEGALVLGGVLSLITIPEIWAKHLGPLNPTVLPGSYGWALLSTWLVLAMLTAAGVGAAAFFARRSQARPFSSSLLPHRPSPPI